MPPETPPPQSPDPDLVALFLQGAGQMLAHLPAALLLAGLILEFDARFSRRPGGDRAASIILWLAAFASILTAVQASVSGALTRPDLPPAQRFAPLALTATCCLAAWLKHICGRTGSHELPKPGGRKSGKVKIQESRQATAVLSYRLALLAALAALAFSWTQQGLTNIQTARDPSSLAEESNTSLSTEPSPADSKPHLASAEPSEEPSGPPDRSGPVAESSDRPEEELSTPPGEDASASLEEEDPMEESSAPLEEEEPSAPGDEPPVEASEPPPPSEDAQDPPAAASTGAPVAFTTVRAIFQNKCTSCHGASKQKGGLRLDSPEAIRKGGKSGPVIVPGLPDDSPAYTLTILPKGDGDIMPAEGEPLRPDQTEKLRLWVLQGANLGDNTPFPGQAKAGQPLPPRVDSSGMDSSALAALGPLASEFMREGVLARSHDPEQSLFEIDFSHRDDPSLPLRLDRLAPIVGKIASLDLTSTSVTESDLKVIASCQNLKRLHLNRTNIGDSGLTHLAKLTALEYLNLYGTQVSDAGLPSLTGLSSLKKLYLWQSRATAQGAAQLQRALPELSINTGDWSRSSPRQAQ